MATSRTPSHRQREPLLTPAEERDLARRARDGDREAVHELVRRNMRLALTLAWRRRCPRGMDRDDLAQWAAIGLHVAATRYDPDHPSRAKFATYAAWWIGQCLTRAAENEGWLIRVPSYVSQAIGRIDRGEPLWRSSARNTRRQVALARRLRFLEPEPGAAPVIESLPDRDAPDGPRAVERADEIAHLRAAMDALPGRLRRVLEGRFWRRETLATIAADLGCTRERVRQLEAEALTLLRERMD